MLAVLEHFFEQRQWGSPAKTDIQGQSLTAEDQLFILTQAGLYLIHARGMSTPEAQACWERAESFSHLLNRPVLLYLALMGQYIYSLMTDTLTATMRVAKRIYSLAREQKDPAIIMGAYRHFAVMRYYSGNFESARRYAMRGLRIWRSGGARLSVEELISPSVECLSYAALSEWHLGEIASCKANMAEAIELAKELNDMAALALALYWAGLLAHFERNPTEVERFASDLIELCTRQTFASWLPGGVILRGWARSAAGDTAAGISRIEDGIRVYQETGAILRLPYFLALKAEALHFAGHTHEALLAISKAEALAARSEGRWWCAEMCRLRAVFLAEFGANETEIEASFCEAIRIAKGQKSTSLAARAEASYLEYRRQKESSRDQES